MLQDKDLIPWHILNYCLGWSSLLIKDGIIAIHPCPSSAALGLDLLPEAQADVHTHVSLSTGYKLSMTRASYKAPFAVSLQTWESIEC